MQDDKLKKLMKESGLLNSSGSDNDFSGSEWTPQPITQFTKINYCTSVSQRKIINPKTGDLEDDLEYVPEISEPKVNRKLINPKSGILEEIDDETGTEQKMKHKAGKKIRRTPKLWTRNKAQEERLKDHTRRNIPNCRCNCRNKITEPEAEQLFKQFMNFRTHTEQNIYLQGCIKEEMTVRFRPRMAKLKARRLFLYTLKLNDKNVTVCSSAFLAVHGIKCNRLKRKVFQKYKDIADGRGKHDNHPRRVPQEATGKVYAFISGLPSRASHYSRTENKHRKYLSADLNISELHRLFLIENPDLKTIVKYEKFRDIFNHNFNISFGSPRKDICNVCEKFKVNIKSAELAQKKEVKQLNIEKELHLRKAETFFEKLKESEMDTDDHTLAICFDYQKNLPLPVTNVQDEYYRRQLWLHNFGIHNIKEGSATMYLYTENYALKGPNEVITALRNYIECNKKPEHTHLKIFCDNCFSQNKNKYLYTSLDQLCCSGIFENVTVIYPIPGHSMMPVDRDFAQIEKKRVKKQTIYSPEYYVELIKNCRITRPFGIVFMERNLRKNEGEEKVIKVKDYKKLYERYIKAVPGISACREVIFSKLKRPMLCSTMNGPFKSFTLYRIGMQRNIRKEPENAYDVPHKLKPSKIKDIIHLLKFVPDEELYFYKDILTTNETNESSQVEANSEDDKE